MLISRQKEQRQQSRLKARGIDVPGPFLVLLLAGAAVLAAQPAPNPIVTYVFPARPPGIALWPKAPYPVNCTAGGVATARDAGGVVTGVLRSAGGRWEILMGGAWVAFEPARHQFTADIYYRIGPCWVGGHGHGSDGEVGTSEELYFPTVHGRAPTLIETVDIKWYPVGSSPYGLYWLRNEWRRLTGQPAPDPPDPPVNLCGNSRCDTGEQFSCRGDCCGDGICQAGETCSADCQPEPPPDPPPPVCPPCTVDEAACRAFIDPIRAESEACAIERLDLQGRVQDLQEKLAAAETLRIPAEVLATLEDLVTARMIGADRRAKVERLGAWLELTHALQPLPGDVIETLRLARTVTLWGSGRQDRARRLRDWLLSKGAAQGGVLPTPEPGHDRN